MANKLLILLILHYACDLFIFSSLAKENYIDDVCGHLTGQRIYLEYAEHGSLTAKYTNNVFNQLQISRNVSQKTCTMEFVTCPSCIIEINFRLLNVSRSCTATVFDTCGCDYVWIYEPQFERVSGDQFCGLFVKKNGSELNYTSQSRRVAVTFIYNENYGHAFTLDYISARNRIVLNGFPKLIGNSHNGSQSISSPFFPNFYPTDLNLEQIINCESVEKCRISLVFTDFHLTDSSIIEFFDWNGQRIFATTGNIFRPPVIISSGPSLIVRFYANGAADSGYKASYSFILGNLNETQFKPNIDCGGPVNNLGGGITMMNMLAEGSKLFDCLWLIKPPGSYSHMKTHLYVKITTFSNFAGNTELTLRQGLTSNGPLVEDIRPPSIASHFYSLKAKEHVVPINQGFYVSLKGLFRPESHLIIVYAAFNYKDCYAGSDFLCRNMRCISILLQCDGFDHCGDNSDELPNTCSKDTRDRREWSKTPNFLFPKVETYSYLTNTFLVFFSCSFGLIGLILALAVLLYRINSKARQQRQIQNHIETIHAILEEGVGEIEEEIIVAADDPPVYEPPPEYKDVVTKKIHQCGSKSLTKQRRSKWNHQPKASSMSGCQSDVSRRIPDSPPPAYENRPCLGTIRFFDSTIDASAGASRINVPCVKWRRHSESDLMVLLRAESCLKWKSFSSSDLIKTHDSIQ